VQIIWLAVLMPMSLLVFILAMIYSSIMFRRTQKHAFDIRSEFPFELMDGREQVLRLGRIYLIIWGALDAALSLYLLVTLTSHSFLLWMAVIFAASILLRDVSFFFLFCIPAFHFKPHFTAFVSSSGLTAFSSAAAVIVCLNAREYVGGTAIGFSIGLGLIGIFAMVIMVNPKLANWAKLESSVDESGAIVERRPKYFVLAFSEWLIVFAGLLLSTASVIAFVLFDIL